MHPDGLSVFAVLPSAYQVKVQRSMRDKYHCRSLRGLQESGNFSACYQGLYLRLDQSWQSCLFAQQVQLLCLTQLLFFL